MKKLDVVGSYQNGGDGSVYTRWFLTQEQADEDQENLEEDGWGEPCTQRVETYEGSNIHIEAVRNSEELRAISLGYDYKIHGSVSDFLSTVINREELKQQLVKGVMAGRSPQIESIVREVINEAVNHMVQLEYIIVED